MEPSGIRSADKRDLAELDVALAGLSRELGDPHTAGRSALETALFGAPPSAWANVADGPHGIAGVVLFGPVFSTVRGGPGVFVSDLWVDKEARGSGIGRALLSSAAETAAGLWGAGFMRLSVHDSNPLAHDIYRSLGFEPITGETVMVLIGQAFQEIRSTP